MSAPGDELETLVQCEDCNGAGCSDCDGLGETLGLDCYEQAASDAIDKLAGEMADRYDCDMDPRDCADVAALSLLAAAYRSAGAMRLDLQNLRAELARAEDGHEEPKLDLCARCAVKLGACKKCKGSGRLYREVSKTSNVGETCPCRSLPGPGRGKFAQTQAAMQGRS